MYYVWYKVGKHYLTLMCFDTSFSDQLGWGRRRRQWKITLGVDYDAVDVCRISDKNILYFEKDNILVSSTL